MTTARRIRGAAMVAATSMLIVQMAAGSPILYTVGPDPSFDPQQLVSIDAGAKTQQSLFPLGNGSFGFVGGLAYASNTNSFYVISQDAAGDSELNTFNLAGGPPASPLLALGMGFNGGMALDTGDGSLYAIGNDALGDSSFYRLNTGGGPSTSLLFALGQGFNGGLAFDSLNNDFYAISNDSLGNSTLNSITLGGIVTPLGLSLQQGYTGGLAFDPGANLFYAIWSDVSGNSTLSRLSLPLNSETQLFGIGQGFNSAAMTLGPTPPTVVNATPEPMSVLLFSGGILAMAWLARFRKRSAAALVLTAGSAFAQYSAPVTVVNPGSQAVPVKDQNNPAYQPVQIHTSFVFQDGLSFYESPVLYTVPNGKILVIDHLAVLGNWTSGNRMQQVRVLDVADIGVADTVMVNQKTSFSGATVQIASRSISAQIPFAIKIEADRNNILGGDFTDVWIKGHLIDAQ